MEVLRGLAEISAELSALLELDSHEREDISFAYRGGSLSVRWQLRTSTKAALAMHLLSSPDCTRLQQKGYRLLNLRRCEADTRFYFGVRAEVAASDE